MAATRPTAPVECPFCLLASGDAVLFNQHAIAVPDGFPVSRGHTLVIPRTHMASLFDLAPDVQAEVWRLVAQVRDLLVEQFRPDAFNVGVNDGRGAGQTVPHAHVHVIPRYAGDVPDPRGGIRWVIPNKAAYWRPDS